MLEGLGWEVIPGANGPTYDPGPINSTTYFVRHARKVGDGDWGLTSNIIVIEVVNDFSVDAGYSTYVCEGETVLLEATLIEADEDETYTFVWSHGLGEGPTKEIQANTSEIYSVTVTNSKGCTAEDEIRVVTRPGPSIYAYTSLAAGQDGVFCAGEIVTLKATIGNGTQEMMWSTSGDGTFTQTDELETMYTFGAQDAENGGGYY